MRPNIWFATIEDKTHLDAYLAAVDKVGDKTVVRAMGFITAPKPLALADRKIGRKRADGQFAYLLLTGREGWQAKLPNSLDKGMATLKDLKPEQISGERDVIGATYHCPRHTGKYLTLTDRARA